MAVKLVFFFISAKSSFQNVFLLKNALYLPTFIDLCNAGTAKAEA
jgi:hypothetical protein